MVRKKIRRKKKPMGKKRNCGVTGIFPGVVCGTGKKKTPKTG